VTTIYRIAHDPEHHRRKNTNFGLRHWFTTLHVPYFPGNPVPYVLVWGTAAIEPLSTYALNRAYKANGNRFNRNPSRLTALASVGVEAAGQTTVGPIADHSRHPLAAPFFEVDSTDLDPITVERHARSKDSLGRLS
jgi:hypothetical protein